MLERQKHIKDLQEFSRQKYLELREGQQLEQKKRILEFEEQLIKSELVNDQEIHLFNLEQKTYNLAKNQ